ncbi:URC4/urg3 family protein [Coralliovum pocilloporae]|uniref:URC4/urg3 family protein n=1 Tax=Coralliovum pocilloporae TaxID=3066369 RepID=UPI003306F3DD
MTELETLSARQLLSATAVRERAHGLLALGVLNQLDHFSVDMDALSEVADFVLDVTRDTYPDGRIPFHARWRHFDDPITDALPNLIPELTNDEAKAAARLAVDLTFVSVLLDAGAGPDWSYEDDNTEQVYTRSEGLAQASLRMFRSGFFSSDPLDPMRVDAQALATLTLDELERGFKVSPSNPLVGLEGRLSLLQKLGGALVGNPDVYETEDGLRPGGLVDHFTIRAEEGLVTGEDILKTLLESLASIWPSRYAIGGYPLGDTWQHRKVTVPDPTNSFIPFHKLSQWLTYSLVEPLQWGRVPVHGLDTLTGLAEYRNGGLFIDLGVLTPKDATAMERSHSADSELIVEWRALTIALLDKLADELRNRTGGDPETLPLARILQGGTWNAGRKIAKARREDGTPPLKIESDGTVF